MTKDTLPSPVSVPEGDAREIARRLVLYPLTWTIETQTEAITAALLSAESRGERKMRERAALTAVKYDSRAYRAIDSLPLSSPEEGDARREAEKPLLYVTVDGMSEAGKVSYWATLFRRGAPDPWYGMSLCKRPVREEAEFEAAHWIRFLQPALDSVEAQIAAERANSEGLRKENGRLRSDNEILHGLVQMAALSASPSPTLPNTRMGEDARDAVIEAARGLDGDV